MSVLSAQQGAASMQAVEMTEDYLLLFCRYTHNRNILQVKCGYSPCIIRQLSVDVFVSALCLRQSAKSYIFVRQCCISQEKLMFLKYKGGSGAGN